MQLSKETMEALAMGGLILGAGGGGSMEEGLKTGFASLDYGSPTMISVEELSPEDVVVTISGVGSPASTEAYVEPNYYNRILELLTKELGQKPKALMPSEMGGASSFGPFVASAVNGIPVLDAACNGRAHPLGTMGSLGLSEKKDHRTIQVALGGDPNKDQQVELIAKGSVNHTASLVLSSAILAGGLVVVARNPVKADFVKTNAAVGCYSQSLEIGKAHLKGKTPEEKIGNVLSLLNGRVLCEGVVDTYQLETRNGLDVGSMTLSGEQEYKVHFWNEYMAIEEDGVRIFTFPDFMMTFHKETGMPLTTAMINEGMEVVLCAASRENLILGGGMREVSGYRKIEEALGIPMLNYVPEVAAKTQEKKGESRKEG